ncbi:hypothetical protein PG993_009873 [Apiospora rasikravindrae]|uniref:Uncharacterized protein n=1 Tax=Apiospora rasikravindrae TaxID=990691 RepID=A0ABR1SMY7_9PEZI
MTLWQTSCQALSKARSFVSVYLWLETLLPASTCLLSSVPAVNPFVFGSRLASILTVDIPAKPSRPQVWKDIADIKPAFKIRARGWPRYSVDPDWPEDIEENGWEPGDPPRPRNQVVPNEWRYPSGRIYEDAGNTDKHGKYPYRGLGDGDLAQRRRFRFGHNRLSGFGRDAERRHLPIDRQLTRVGAGRDHDLPVELLRLAQDPVSGTEAPRAPPDPLAHPLPPRPAFAQPWRLRSLVDGKARYLNSAGIWAMTAPTLAFSLWIEVISRRPSASFGHKKPLWDLSGFR